MSEQEFAELAAGYALDALSPAERSAFETARAQHPEWERWVLQDAAAAAELADGVPEALPPLTLRSSLLSRIASMPQLPAVDAAVAAVAEPVDNWSPPPMPSMPAMPAMPATPAMPPMPAGSKSDEPVTEPAPNTSVIQAVQRRNWTRGLLAGAAALVVLVALGFGAATVNEYVNRPPEIVAMQQIEDAPDALSATAEIGDSGSATAMWSEEVGKTVLVSNGLPIIGADETYEVWFVRDDEPVSAGTFEPNESGGATTLLDGTVQTGDVIALTVEEAGGSSTGEPTTDPIVAIPTS